ncbi:MAG: hypothetical protein RTU30_14425 [Candidatus Thorarchaeota archaeon]
MSAERRIVVRGLWSYNQVRVEEIESTFIPSVEQMNLIEQRWSKKPSDIFDEPRWRFEGVDSSADLMTLRLSRTSYKWHYVLREEQYSEPSQYPNPASVTTLLITGDNRLILGVRKGSDQGNRLHAVGGGFIDPIKSSESESSHPENVFITSHREISEETNLEIPFQHVLDNFRILGAVWGNNHDTTLVMFAPVDTHSSKVAIRGDEHSTLFFPAASVYKINGILEEQTLEDAAGVVPTDHMLLALELLRDYLTTESIGGD